MYNKNMTSLTTNNEDLYSKIFAGWDDTNSNFNEAVTNASLSGLSVIRLTSNSEVAKPKERGDDNNTKKKDDNYTADNLNNHKKKTLMNRINLIRNKLVKHLDKVINSKYEVHALHDIEKSTSVIDIDVIVDNKMELQKTISVLKDCNYSYNVDEQDKIDNNTNDRHMLKFNFAEKDDDGGGKRNLYVSIKSEEKYGGNVVANVS